MKDCSLKRAMMTPFTKPAAAPLAIAIASAAPMPSWSAMPANSTPPSATTEPTLRSMPPVRITSSMPRLIRPFATTWRIRLLMLRSVKKASANQAPASSSATKPAMRPRSSALRRGSPPANHHLPRRASMPSACMRRLHPARGAGQDLLLGRLLRA